MPSLPYSAREKIWGEFNHDLSVDNSPVGSVTKQDLRAAVDALDDWITNSAPTLDEGIPEPARSALTPHQKTRLFMLIVAERYAEGM
jgi:hypothetical protein